MTKSNQDSGSVTLALVGGFLAGAILAGRGRRSSEPWDSRSFRSDDGNLTKVIALGGVALVAAALLLGRGRQGGGTSRDAHDFWREPAISTGPNARPRNETISQTGGGLPDDTSSPIEISDEEERRIAQKILSM